MGDGHEWVRADLNVDPFFLRKSLVLILKDLAGCHVGSVDGMSERGSREVEWVSMQEEGQAVDHR